MDKNKLPCVDFTKTEAYSKLTADKIRIQDMRLGDWFHQNPHRFHDFSQEWKGILVDYSKNKIDEQILQHLLNLASDCNLEIAIKQLFSGNLINETEKRAALHMALRATKNEVFEVNQENVVTKVHDELSKMENLANQILNGNWKGFSGKQIQNVINIGIGGSDLGPRMVTGALKPFQQNVKVQYISNVDPHQFDEVLNGLNPETTLFIIASKTFTTLETMLNAQTAKAWLLNTYDSEPIVLRQHFIAVSSHIDEVKKFGIPQENHLEFWDWAGGRFSIWSAIGFSVMIAIGPKNFQNLLKGAHQSDLHFKNNPFKKNLPVLLALIDIWNQNFLGYENHAIIPYYHYLKDFPAYLQQLEMESNGKSTNREGQMINYQTGRIIWGGTGTDSQHAFFQLLHQGTQKIAVDFIGVIDNGKPSSCLHHKTLLSSLIAQTKALMEGSDKNLEGHLKFEGNKPSTTILLEKLDPEKLGQLMAIYEHKIFVQGIIWNIFSFDQWGVELGKTITKNIYSATSEQSSEISNNWDSSTLGLLQTLKKWQID